MLEQRNDKLTKNEELQLGKEIQAMKKMKARIEAGYVPTLEDEAVILKGDESLEILISNYYNLARDIAHKYHKRTGTKYNLDDLLQDAVLALVEAAYNYDPSKNCKLSTYAFYGISKKVSSTINFQRVVRMPENKMGEYALIKKAKDVYMDMSPKEQMQYNGELDYIYKNVDLDKKEIDLILNNMQPTVSLNTVFNEGNTEMITMLKDEKAHIELTRIETVNGELLDVVKKLNQYELDLIAFEFGIFEASMSYDEFIKKYDYTSRKVNIETKKVIAKMKRLAETA